VPAAGWTRRGRFLPARCGSGNCSLGKIAWASFSKPLVARHWGPTTRPREEASQGSCSPRDGLAWAPDPAALGCPLQPAGPHPPERLQLLALGRRQAQNGAGRSMVVIDQPPTSHPFAAVHRRNLAADLRWKARTMTAKNLLAGLRRALQQAQLKRAGQQMPLLADRAGRGKGAPTSLSRALIAAGSPRSTRKRANAGRRPLHAATSAETSGQARGAWLRSRPFICSPSWSFAATPVSLRRTRAVDTLAVGPGPKDVHGTVGTGLKPASASDLSALLEQRRFKGKAAMFSPSSLLGRPPAQLIVWG